jgi:hypothetical protein
MSVEASTQFTYSVEDINQSVRRTNALLRAANAVRLSIRDIQQVWRKPTIVNVSWTLVQLSRTYNALRRIMRLVVDETNAGASLAGIMRRIVMPPITEAPMVIPPSIDLAALSIRVDAFRENLPMGLDGLDLSGLPEESRTMIQGILEEDAQQTVNDAKMVLAQRILHPEESTGFLESSISWMPEVDGVRIYANAPYAWWVERGHDNFRGHWYLKTATDWAKLRLPEKIRMEINGLIFRET